MLYDYTDHSAEFICGKKVTVTYLPLKILS